MVLCRISSQSRRSKVRWWPWPYWPHLWENWRGEHKVAFNACRWNENFCRTGILAGEILGAGFCDNESMGGEERRKCCKLATSMQHVLWGCRIQRTSTSIQNHDIVNKTWNSRIHSLTVVHKSGKWLAILRTKSRPLWQAGSRVGSPTCIVLWTK